MWRRRCGIEAARYGAAGTTARRDATSPRFYGFGKRRWAETTPRSRRARCSSRRAPWRTGGIRRPRGSTTRRENRAGKPCPFVLSSLLREARPTLQEWSQARASSRRRSVRPPRRRGRSARRASAKIIRPAAPARWRAPRSTRCSATTSARRSCTPRRTRGRAGSEIVRGVPSRRPRGLSASRRCRDDPFGTHAAVGSSSRQKASGRQVPLFFALGRQVPLQGAARVARLPLRVAAAVRLADRASRVQLGRPVVHSGVEISISTKPVFC